MGDINVPPNFKHMMKRDRNSKEYNEATIRDYVQAHPGVVITGVMFQDALDGLTTASAIVRKLVKKGKLVRKQVYNGQRGHAYTYTWVNGGTVTPLKTKETNSPVVTHPRTGYATDHEIKRLNEWFLDYCDAAKTGETIRIVNHFRQFVVKKYKGEDNASTEKTEI